MYEKNIGKNRLSPADAIELWHDAPLAELGVAALRRKIELSGADVYYNRNIHIEPTNICAFRCSFCSYRREDGQEGAWYHTMEQIEQILAQHAQKPITEVHIVGGVHPNHDLDYYCKLIKLVKARLPHVAVKAYTAVELNYIIQKAGLTIEEGLKKLIDAGMAAIPGGGAEIFDEEVRSKICPAKCSATEWLNLHQAAHKLGITTNATMLYGHIETIEHRISHLAALRDLQDATGGFSAFIPLKFRTANNDLGQSITETPIVEDMRMFAICRLFLDNFPHIKAYWPMLGIDATELALSFGADDIDGTIDDTTKIYSMAGSDVQRPALSPAQCRDLIISAGFNPVERDTFYNPLPAQDA